MFCCPIWRFMALHRRHRTKNNRTTYRHNAIEPKQTATFDRLLVWQYSHLSRIAMEIQLVEFSIFLSRSSTSLSCIFFFPLVYRYFDLFVLLFCCCTACFYHFHNINSFICWHAQLFSVIEFCCRDCLCFCHSPPHSTSHCVSSHLVWLYCVVFEYYK